MTQLTKRKKTRAVLVGVARREVLAVGAERDRFLLVVNGCELGRHPAGQRLAHPDRLAPAMPEPAFCGEPPVGRAHWFALEDAVGPRLGARFPLAPGLTVGEHVA